MKSSLTAKEHLSSKEMLRTNLQQQGYHLVPGLVSPARVLEVRKFLKEKFEKRFVDEELERDDTVPDHMCLYPELMDTFFNDTLDRLTPNCARS